MHDYIKKSDLTNIGHDVAEKPIFMEHVDESHPRELQVCEVDVFIFRKLKWLAILRFRLMHLDRL